MATASTTRTADLIFPDCLYPKSEVKRILRKGEHAWTAMVRRGLKVLREGKSVYVRGSDLIAHIDQVSQDA